MGLLDFFKRDKKTSEQTNKEIVPNIEKSKISVRDMPNGKIEVELYDADANFGQFYDTTKLIMDKNSYRLGNSTVSDCLISWYNQDDVIFVDGQSSRDIYENIIASLDVEKMIMDKQYCTFAMKKLLNQKRVMEYIERGKSNEPQEYPCGNYVGGVTKTDEGKLIKTFDPRAGIESHNSPYMQKVRLQEKMKLEKAKERKKAELESKMKSIQDELEKL